jgi:hypothetical protein
MAIRLTESALRRIIREEVHQISRTRRRIAEAGRLNSTYYVPLENYSMEELESAIDSGKPQSSGDIGSSMFGRGLYATAEEPRDGGIEIRVDTHDFPDVGKATGDASSRANPNAAGYHFNSARDGQAIFIRDLSKVVKVVG